MTLIIINPLHSRVMLIGALITPYILFSLRRYIDETPETVFHHGIT